MPENERLWAPVNGSAPYAVQLFFWALQNGVLGSLIGTAALAAIAAQYMGFIDSPLAQSHVHIIRAVQANSSALIYSRGVLDRMETLSREQVDGIQTLCYIQADTTDDKYLCTHGLK